MANQYVNKVVVKNDAGEEEVKLDLTQDTIDGMFLIEGYTFHDKTGAPQTGWMELVDLKTFADEDSDGGLTGKAFEKTFKTLDDYFDIGETHGDYQAVTNRLQVKIAQSEKDKIIAENIKKDVSILGVTGTLDSANYTLEDNDAGGQTLTIGQVIGYEH